MRSRAAFAAGSWRYWGGKTRVARVSAPMVVSMPSQGEMPMPVRLLLSLAAALMVAAPAAAQTDFKIGVVASLSGAFASAATDENAGVQAWVKARGLHRPENRLRDAGR